MRGQLVFRREYGNGFFGDGSHAGGMGRSGIIDAAQQAFRGVPAPFRPPQIQAQDLGQPKEEEGSGFFTTVGVIVTIGVALVGIGGIVLGIMRAVKRARLAIQTRTILKPVRLGVARTRKELNRFLPSFDRLRSQIQATRDVLQSAERRLDDENFDPALAQPLRGELAEMRNRAASTCEAGFPGVRPTREREVAEERAPRPPGAPPPRAPTPPPLPSAPARGAIPAGAVPFRAFG